MHTSETIIDIFEDFGQELILIRSSNDKDAVISVDDSEEPRLEITRLTSYVSRVVPNPQE